MNEDIIRMAREAGGYTTEKYPDEWRMDADDLKRLVELVKAEEREACAKLVEEEKLMYEKRAAEPEEFRDINPEVARIAGMTCDFNAAAIRARDNNERRHHPHGA